MATRAAIGRVSEPAPDWNDERIDALRALYPEAFSEGQVDFDKLREALGVVIDGRPERYSFTWAGKQSAIRMLQAPSSGTLTPDPAESVDFETTQHLFIEGENLEVLKLLYKSYFGRIKMIYIDPPYNTGNDFVYSDDYTQPLDAYLRLTGQKDEEGNLLTSNTESSGRFHSNWLSMMYPRLFLARQLLREDGVIFVSIDDHEVYNLRMLMNEIFGEENFVATVIWQKVYSPKNSARHFSEDHDYILVYAKDADSWTPRLLPRTAEMEARYTNPDNDPRGPWKPADLSARNYYGEGTYPVTCPSGRVIDGPPKGRYWTVSETRLRELDKDQRIWWGAGGNNAPALKVFQSEVRAGRVPQTLWTYGDVGHTQEAKKELLEAVHFGNTDNVLDTVKPTRLIRRMLQLATTVDDGDIVLDFFAGSAASAHAVLLQNQEDGGNRRFICVQLPEPLPVPESRLKSIADIAEQRILNVGARLKHAHAAQLDLDERAPDLGVRVFKLAPSAWRQWQPLPAETDPTDYARALELYHDPLIGDWTPEAVIYEVMLREGYSLTSRVEPVECVSDATVWRVSDDEREQSFFICLDAAVTLEAIKPLGLSRDDLFICRDVALDDTAAANLALQCRLKTI